MASNKFLSPFICIKVLCILVARGLFGYNSAQDTILYGFPVWKPSSRYPDCVPAFTRYLLCTLYDPDTGCLTYIQAFYERRQWGMFIFLQLGGGRGGG